MVDLINKHDRDTAAKKANRIEEVLSMQVYSTKLKVFGAVGLSY